MCSLNNATDELNRNGGLPPAFLTHSPQQLAQSRRLPQARWIRLHASSSASVEVA